MRDAEPTFPGGPAPSRVPDDLTIEAQSDGTSQATGARGRSPWLELRLTMLSPDSRQIAARRDSVRRRDRVRQLEELRRTLRVGSLVVAPVLFATALSLALRFPDRGPELFALWTTEAAAVGLLHVLAGRAARRSILALTVVFSIVPAIGLPTTLAIEPDTFLMMITGFAILPVAVPLFLTWPRIVRTTWILAYATALSTLAIFVGFAGTVGMARMDIAIDVSLGCLIGWIGGELLERPRLRSLEHDLELRRLNRVLRGHATTDPLTGLANRRQLETDLGLLAVSLRQAESPCTVVMLDLDRFKRLNDELGHAAGDAAMRAVASELRSLVRGRDTVYRYGGEEFLVILPDTALEGGVDVAERIRLAIERLSIPAATTGALLTISGGVAVSEPPHLTWDAVLAASDAALYQAKAGGRNRVCCATAEAISAEAAGSHPERRASVMRALRPEDRTAGA